LDIDCVVVWFFKESGRDSVALVSFLFNIGDASECNLFNVEGFPAVPFRSDEWKTITKEEKYKIDIIVN